MSKKTEPTPAVRALQAEAAEARAKHQDPATAAASAVQHNDLRAHAAESAGSLQRRPF